MTTTLIGGLAAPGHASSKDGLQMPVLHQRQVVFVLNGAQVAAGTSQYGVRLLHEEAVHARPDPGLVARL